MSRTVYTKEIMEAWAIDATPMTQEQIFEREQAIEKRWLEEFKKLEDSVDERVEMRLALHNPVTKAQARIGEAAQSALHNKGVVVPSVIKAQNFVPGQPMAPSEIDEEALTQVNDSVMTYIGMGRDFEVILQAIRDNPMLMSEWERFMITLRMCQED